MKDTYLVQTLEAPAKSDWEHKANQAFGGGLLLLNAETWKLLRPIFSFRYMGAAEFEFGAIPECLRALAQDAEKLVSTSFVIKGNDIQLNWNKSHRLQMARHQELKEAKAKGVKAPRAKKPKDMTPTDKTVYVLCRGEQQADIEKRIRELAKNKIQLKRGAGFINALDPVDEYDRKGQGWLELSNGFFFFVDQAMWQGTVDLFKRFIPGEADGHDDKYAGARD